jgi:hypothetical protein
MLSTLKQLTGQEWADVPADLMRRLIKALVIQLRAEPKQQVVQKEIATILGQMGARSKPALPQLIEMLQDSVPNPVREAAVTEFSTRSPIASAIDRSARLPRVRPAEMVRCCGAVVLPGQ